jgi:YD repeat-containing protein
MMRRFMLVVLSVAVILLLPFVAEAQAPNVCDGQEQFFFGDDPIPGAYLCIPEGPFISVCYFKTDQCSPNDAPLETAPGCGGKGANGGGTPVPSPPPNSGCSAGEPINLANGNTYIMQNDFAIPGLGGGLSLKRTWNSKWPASQSSIKPGLFGQNWRSTYEERIFLGTDGYTKYSRSDGTFWSWGAGTGGLKPVAPRDIRATLTLANRIWTLTFKDGSKRTFDYNSGWLKSIVDRNGNTITVAYDANNRITTVTDPANRTITFNYPNSTSLLISSLVSNAGTFTYNYDGQGRLIKVTRPDNTFTTFEYDANSLISTVKDTDGKLLEGHTYDSQGRGLTSTRANGVDAVTVSYPK